MLRRFTTFEASPPWFSACVLYRCLVLEPLPFDRMHRSHSAGVLGQSIVLAALPCELHWRAIDFFQLLIHHSVQEANQSAGLKDKQTLRANSNHPVPPDFPALSIFSPLRDSFCLVCSRHLTHSSWYYSGVSTDDPKEQQQ